MIKRLSIILLLSTSLNAQDPTEQAIEIAKTDAFAWKEASHNEVSLMEQAAIATNAKKRWSTNALLIIKQDQILFERYYNGFKKDQKQRLWSISKSFSSALIGVALKKGLLSLETKASEYFDNMKEKTKSTINVRHLLEMSSGLKWIEGYELNPFKSHVVAMLYLLHKSGKNMPSYVAKRTATHRPGRVFHYSSGETNLLLALLKRSLGNQEIYNDFPWKELFIPIGISDATWEQDLKGNLVGSSYLYLKARDLARLGRLYLEKGTWQNKEVISKRFVANSLKPSSASCQSLPISKKFQYSYGYQWWLNGGCSENPDRKAFKDLPSNTFFALGHHGQIMAVFPDLKAIAIRLGADKKGAFDRGQWLESVYKGLKKIDENTRGL